MMLEIILLSKHLHLQSPSPSHKFKARSCMPSYLGNFQTGPLVFIFLLLLPTISLLSENHKTQIRLSHIFMKPFHNVSKILSMIYMVLYIWFMQLALYSAFFPFLFVFNFYLQQLRSTISFIFSVSANFRLPPCFSLCVFISVENAGSLRS